MVRIASQRPYSSASPWNTAVGSSAVYESNTGALGAALRSISSSNVTINSNNGYGIQPVFAASTDPVAQVYHFWDSTMYPQYTHPIPATAAIETGSDHNLGVIYGQYYYDYWQTTRVSTTSYSMNWGTKSDMLGAGIGEYDPGAGQYAVRASGFSTLGGLIRASDLDAGVISHAMVMSVPQSIMESGFIWPAYAEDHNNSYAGVIPMGSLFAIPSTVNLSSLTLTTEGLMLATALQNYGIYVGDSGGSIALVAEDAIAATRATPFSHLYADWATNSFTVSGSTYTGLLGLLRAVTNNTSTTVGGGGTPRVATQPAPVLAAPVVGVGPTSNIETAVYHSGAWQVFWTAPGATPATINIPFAVFTANPVQPTGLVNFDASNSHESGGSAAIAKYTWDFGDGSQPVSTTNNTIQHTYAMSGNYNVELLLTDTLGVTEEVGHDIAVLISGPPSANFTYQNSQGTAVVSVDGSTSTDSSAGITDYAWNFGDGATADGVTQVHTYAAAGNYTITLVITDGVGNTASTSKAVVVDGVGAAASFTTAISNYTVTTDASASVSAHPITDYSWDWGLVSVSISESVSGLVLTYSSTAKSASGASITGYAWNFGDSGVSSTSSGTHTYAAAGSYTLTLVCTDSSGATGSATQSVVINTSVNHAPTVTMTISGTAATYTATLVGYDADGDAMTYSVNWGDGGTTTGATSTYVYSTSGTRTVTATVTDVHGATGSTTGSVTATVPTGGGGTTGNGKNGDSGINQTGVSGKQQTGTGVLLEQNLTAGADLTATLANAGTSAISFPAGTFKWNGFTHGVDATATASGNNSSGLRFPNGVKSVFGAGSASTFLEATPNSTSSSIISGVPAQGSGLTNQLQYIDVDAAVNGFVWDGINMVGTAQGCLYNGLRLRAPGNITISNSTFSGIPGSGATTGGSPPGETFSINVYAQANTSTVNVTNCSFDGRQNGTAVASALLGTNNTRGVINITDCYFHDNIGSAGPTIWELAAGATINIVRPITSKLKRNIGNEAQAGTINIYDPLFGDPVAGEDDIRVTWTAGYNSGTINVYFTAQANWNAFIANRTNKKILTQCTVLQNYGGSNGPYTGSNNILNYLHIFIAGKEQTLATYWTVTGHPSN